MKLLLRKIGSYIIDYAIAGGIVSIFYFCANVFFLKEETRTQGELMLVCALISILFLTIYIPYQTQGQTLGEKIMKIRVYNINGKPISYLQCFIRETVIKFTCGALFVIFTIVYFIVNNIFVCHNINEALPHDFILKTEVRYENK